MKRDRKEPLYRKENTKARGVHHFKGSDAKYDRNTKKGLNKSMKKDVNRGLDYTPLFRFLLSKVGKPWSEVHSEAVQRLDREDPIYWMVDLVEDHKDVNDYCRIGESTFWSKLIVDEDGILRIKIPNFKNEDLYPSCHCCTHTFNGTKLQKTYEDSIKKYANIKI